MRFPLKTALALATCVLLLAAWHARNRTKGLSPAIFADAWRLHGAHPAAAPAPPPQQAAGQPIEAHSAGQPATAAPRPRVSAFLIDDSGALNPFYAALGRLETGGTQEHVTILHYGDSPTTADLITGDVRSLLQTRFGDAGHGYLLLAKPWAWYGHWDTDIAGHGWTVSTAVGKGRAEIYGLGGASFEGTAGAESHITLKDAPRSSFQTTMTLSFLAQPQGGSVRITADTAAGDHQPVGTVETAAETVAPAWLTLALPPGTKAVDVSVGAGKATVFGETFERAQPGVIYDSLGLNGASTTVLSRGFNAEAWATELRHEAPALVIINYGTNESSFGAFVDRQYEGELRLAIGRIRNALPAVSVLVMSPMDRGERSGIADISTMATMPRIVAIERRVAADTHCAFFDTFDAMGGDGTMARWYAGHPRLVAGDLIHPTPQGAAIVGQIFVKNLLLGYDASRPKPAPQPAGPAQPKADLRR